MRFLTFLFLSICTLLVAEDYVIGASNEDNINDANLDDFDMGDEEFNLDIDNKSSAPSNTSMTKEDVNDFPSKDEEEKLNLGSDNEFSNSLDANIPTAKTVELPTTPKDHQVEPLPETPVVTPQSVQAKLSPEPPQAELNSAVQNVPSTESDAVPVIDVPAMASAVVVSENDFSGTPYVPGGRRVMAFGEAPEYYKVEPGDTLFDICDQLIDEPDYWPKLWALNPGIKNPHFIFPGMMITFFPGDDTTPPYLEVVSEEDILPLDTEGLKEEDLIAQPTSDIADKIDKQNALAFEYMSPEESDASKLSIESDFEIMGAMYAPNLVSLTLPAFFFQDEIEPVATVLAGPIGELAVQEKNEVIIEMEGQALSQGQSLTVVRPSGKIKNAQGETIGYRYEFVAHARITIRTEDEDATMAVITKSRLAVMPDDILIDYRSTARSLQGGKFSSISSASDASIIGFEYPTQTIGGEGHVVFIDKQLTPGTTLPIYQKTSLRIPRLLRLSIPDSTMNVGYIKIIDNNGPSSTGVIVYSRVDARFGDSLGRG